MTTENQTTEQQEVDAAAPSISIQDIENAVKVIDYACEQGAFKGWGVVQQVIVVRDRLATFVTAAKPPEAETTETEQTEAAQ